MRDLHSLDGENEPLDGDEALGNGIDRKEKALERHRPQKGGTFGRDEAWRADILILESEPNFGDRP